MRNKCLPQIPKEAIMPRFDDERIFCLRSKLKKGCDMTERTRRNKSGKSRIFFMEAINNE